MNNEKFLLYFKESKSFALNLSLKTGVKAYPLEVLTYSFGEFTVQLPEVPHQADVYFIMQNVGAPADLLVRVLMTINALENTKPRRVNLIIPYLPFSRQDRKKADNRAVASRVLADIFNTGYVSNIYTFDLHNAVITDYFKMPVYNLTMLDAFVTYFQSLALEDVVIVAPDYGRFNAAKYVANAFKNASFVLINKFRDEKNQVHVSSIEGDTKGKTALIIEDIIDTGNTLVSAVSALKEQGVKAIYVAATHGVFSSNALRRIKALGIKKVIITNTIPHDIADSLVEVLPIEDHLIAIIKD